MDRNGFNRAVRLRYCGGGERFRVECKKLLEPRGEVIFGHRVEDGQGQSRRLTGPRHQAYVGLEACPSRRDAEEALPNVQER